MKITIDIPDKLLWFYIRERRAELDLDAEVRARDAAGEPRPYPHVLDDARTRLGRALAARDVGEPGDPRRG